MTPRPQDGLSWRFFLSSQCWAGSGSLAKIPGVSLPLVSVQRGRRSRQRQLAGRSIEPIPSGRFGSMLLPVQVVNHPSDLGDVPQFRNLDSGFIN